MSESNERMMRAFESDREKYKQVIRERSVVRLDGCWEWQGPLDIKGYGKLSVGKYRDNACIRVHKVSFYLFNPDKIPADGLCVCHKCDNPCCVNPDHLFVGTNQDNVDDKVSKDRHARGERHGYAELTEIQVREIVRLLLDGVKTRAIAEQFNISNRHVHMISCGRKWKCVTGGRVRPSRYTYLSEQDQKEITEVWLKSQCKKTWLAELYDVSPSTIQRIIQRRTQPSH